MFVVRICVAGKREGACECMRVSECVGGQICVWLSVWAMIYRTSVGVERRGG